jgi:MoxR-like ATPase
MDMASKIQDLRTALNQKFLERDELIDGMLTSLLSKEPLLMIGPPGTAKSAICQAICSSLNGKFFAWMLGKLTTPEELFGPLSLKGLEQDRYTRVIDGKLPTANVAFLDEVFKGSSAILNTLLTITNEKIFYNDGKAVDVPLKTLYAASNEIPQAEELSAFYDRFVLRYYVEHVHEEASAKALFSGLPDVKMPTVTLPELDKEQDKASKVKLGTEIVEKLIHLRREVAQEGISVSDRKWVQSVRVIKAHAHLNDRDEVDESDLVILGNVLWSDVEQRVKVRRLVARVANPAGEKMMQIMDAVSDIERNMAAGKIDSIEAFKKIRHAVKELQKLDDPKKNKPLARAIDKVKEMQRSIAKEHLDIDE